MKLRNQLLALFCLLIFAGFGFFYVVAWVVQKPFGIILFVSDAMTPQLLTAARLYQGGADETLALEAFKNVALLRNSAADFSVPDAAAAGTALATGVKVNHRVLGLDAQKRQLSTILDLARAQGRTAGLVTDGLLTSPGAAAFYAHTADARNSAELALQLFAAQPLQVVLGGGSAFFLPKTAGGQRTDGRDLMAEMKAQGREIVTTKAALEDASSYRDAGLLGLFSSGELAFSNSIESGSEQPSLSDMVRRAIECLQTNGKGYVLVVNASLVTTALEENQGERAITETLALDRAVSTAVRYAGAKSLIIAVGRHGAGGINLNGYPLRQDHGVALLGTNAAGQPAITWATGPNGPAVASSLPPPNAAGDSPPTAPASSQGASTNNEPAAFQTSSALNTAEDVLAIGRGPGAEKLRGFMENTEIFQLIKEAL